MIVCMIDSVNPNLMFFLNSCLQNYLLLGFVSIYMISCKEYSFYYTSKLINPKLFVFLSLFFSLSHSHGLYT